MSPKPACGDMEAETKTQEEIEMTSIKTNGLNIFKQSCFSMILLGMSLSILSCDNADKNTALNSLRLNNVYVGQRGFVDISPVDSSAQQIAFCDYQGKLTIGYVDETHNITVYTYNGAAWEKLDNTVPSSGNVPTLNPNPVSLVAINDELYVGYVENDPSTTTSNKISYVVKKYSNSQWTSAGSTVTSISEPTALISAKMVGHNGRLFVAYSHQTFDVNINVSKLKELVDDTWVEVIPSDFSTEAAVSLDFTFNADTPTIAHSYGFIGIGIKSLQPTGWVEELSDGVLFGYDLSLLVQNDITRLSYSEYMPENEYDRLKAYQKINGAWQEINIPASTGYTVRTLLFEYQQETYLAYIHYNDNMDEDDQLLISIAKLVDNQFITGFEKSFPIHANCYNHNMFFLNGALYVGFYDYENQNKLSVIQISGFQP